MAILAVCTLLTLIIAIFIKEDLRRVNYSKMKDAEAAKAKANPQEVQLTGNNQ